MASFGEVWNGLIFEIGETIDDGGLEELIFRDIHDIGDNGSIEAWPLSIFSHQCTNL